MRVYRNRLAEYVFDRELLAKRLNMTRGNLQRIINNERDLRVDEMFAICEFLKVTPDALFVPAEANIATDQLRLEATIATAQPIEKRDPSQLRYMTRLLAVEDDPNTNAWLCDGLYGKLKLLPDIKAALEAKRPWLPIVPGRTLLGRAVDESAPATRHYSLKREDNTNDLSVSRLHIEIYSSQDSPEIIVYCHRALDFEIEGERCKRLEGECASLRNGDKIYFPNEAVLELDSYEV